MALMVLASYVSILPDVQEHSDVQGLGPTSIICLYCSYLIMSAVASEPDDRNCNPLVRANGTRTATIVLGAIATFVTLAYTTTNAASALSLETDPVVQAGRKQAIALTETDPDILLRAADRAVREGALPASDVQDVRASALAQAARLERGSTAVTADEEEEEEEAEQKYYPRFHLVFMLAAMWVATLLKMNISPEGSGGDLVAVGRTYWYSWVKIVLSWVYYAHYIGGMIYSCN